MAGGGIGHGCPPAQAAGSGGECLSFGVASSSDGMSTAAATISAAVTKESASATLQRAGIVKKSRRGLKTTLQSYPAPSVAPHNASNQQASAGPAAWLNDAGAACAASRETSTAERGRWSDNEDQAVPPSMSSQQADAGPAAWLNNTRAARAASAEASTAETATAEQAVPHTMSSQHVDAGPAAWLNNTGAARAAPAETATAEQAAASTVLLRAGIVKRQRKAPGAQAAACGSASAMSEAAIASPGGFRQDVVHGEAPPSAMAEAAISSPGGFCQDVVHGEAPLSAMADAAAANSGGFCQALVHGEGPRDEFVSQSSSPPDRSAPQSSEHAAETGTAAAVAVSQDEVVQCIHHGLEDRCGEEGEICHQQTCSTEQDADADSMQEANDRIARADVEVCGVKGDALSGSAQRAEDQAAKVGDEVAKNEETQPRPASSSFFWQVAGVFNFFSQVGHITPVTPQASAKSEPEPSSSEKRASVHGASLLAPAAPLAEPAAKAEVGPGPGEFATAQAAPASDTAQNSSPEGRSYEEQASGPEDALNTPQAQAPHGAETEEPASGCEAAVKAPPAQASSETATEEQARGQQEASSFEAEVMEDIGSSGHVEDESAVPPIGPASSTEIPAPGDVGGVEQGVVGEREDEIIRFRVHGAFAPPANDASASSGPSHRGPCVEPLQPPVEVKLVCDATSVRRARSQREYPRELMLIAREQLLERKRKHRTAMGRGRLLTVSSSHSLCNREVASDAPIVIAHQPSEQLVNHSAPETADGEHADSRVYSRAQLLEVYRCTVGRTGQEHDDSVVGVGVIHTPLFYDDRPTKGRGRGKGAKKAGAESCNRRGRGRHCFSEPEFATAAKRACSEGPRDRAVKRRGRRRRSGSKETVSTGAVETRRRHYYDRSNSPQPSVRQERPEEWLARGRRQRRVEDELDRGSSEDLARALSEGRLETRSGFECSGDARRRFRISNADMAHAEQGARHYYDASDTCGEEGEATMGTNAKEWRANLSPSQALSSALGKHPDAGMSEPSVDERPLQRGRHYFAQSDSDEDARASGPWLASQARCAASSSGGGRRTRTVSGVDGGLAARDPFARTTASALVDQLLTGSGGRVPVQDQRARHYFGECGPDGEGPSSKTASRRGSQEASASSGTRRGPLVAESQAGGLGRWIRENAKLKNCGRPRARIERRIAAAPASVPLYVGLNLEHAFPLFRELATSFAQNLADEFHIRLTVPEPSAAQSAQADRDLEAYLHAVGSGSTRAQTPFRWPQALHMTTFYLGGDLAALANPGARHALEIEGSSWIVQPTHVLYAEGALLIAVLDVMRTGLPMEVGCIPHATLLSRPPFVPGESQRVLQQAMSAGVIGRKSLTDRRQTDQIFVLPRIALAGAVVDVYVQRLDLDTAPTFNARLECF